MAWGQTKHALLHDCLDLDVLEGDEVFEDNFCHSSLMSHPTLTVPQTCLKHSSTTFGSDTSPCDYLWPLCHLQTIRVHTQQASHHRPALYQGRRLHSYVVLACHSSWAPGTDYKSHTLRWQASTRHLYSQILNLCPSSLQYQGLQKHY